jgi:hypothetical protein
VPEALPRTEPASDDDGEEESEEEVESNADGGPEYMEVWVPEGDWSRAARCVFMHLEARGAAATPGPFIHAAMHSVMPGLHFEMTPSSRGVLLSSPSCADREAAVGLQPFSHEDVEVRLERVEETEDRFVGVPEWLAHVVAWNFPEEHWDGDRIRAVFGCVGTAMEIDPLCFPGTDRSSLHLVIELNNPHVPYLALAGSG